MKKPLAVLPQLVLFSFLTFALPAAGAGGAGTQGPRFLGAGLDKPTGFPGAYYLGDVQEFSLGANPFPPANLAQLAPVPLAQPPKFQLLSLTCKPDGANSLLAKCEGLFNSNSTVCTESDPSHKPVKLIALNAKWDSLNKTL